MNVSEIWEENQFVNAFGTANNSINTPENCEWRLWLIIIIDNNNYINADVNGTYLGSFLKYYHLLNDCLYLCEGFNRAVHSLSTWILLLKSSSISQFSLHRWGLKLCFTPQCKGIIWSSGHPSVQKMLFHRTRSPVGKRGKDNLCGTTYCSQSRKRQKLWQWCLESSCHGLKTTLSKGKKKKFLWLASWW